MGKMTPTPTSPGKIFTAILAAAALAGCVSVVDGTRSGGGDADGGPPLLPAPFPTYQVGDQFEFDDGIRERVIEVSDGLVSWRNNRRFGFADTGNPFLPRTGWSSRTRSSQQTNINVPPDALWPLAVGKKATVKYSYEITNRKTGETNIYSRRDECSVLGTETVEVPAGSYRTYKVRCYRYSGARSLGERIWHYAPEIGHYVQRKDRYFYARSSKVRRLVNMGNTRQQLPDLVSQGFRAAVQQALQSVPSGETLSWTAPDTPYAIEVKPLRTFRTSKGFYCREYRVRRTVEGRRLDAANSACRMEDGVWRLL